MSSVTVDTSEVDAWARVLSGVGLKIVKRREVDLDEVAEEMQQRARASAPVLTGALQASIYLNRNKESRRVGTRLKQGFFQEFGTSRHPPQPWLFQHIEAANRRLFKTLGDDGVAVLR